MSHVAYLVRFRPIFEDSRVLPHVERVVTVDLAPALGVGIRPNFVGQTEMTLTMRGEPLGWIGVEIVEIRYLGAAEHVTLRPTEDP